MRKGTLGNWGVGGLEGCVAILARGGEGNKENSLH